MAKDANEIARLLMARHPQAPFYFIGESMGGAVVLAALSSPEAPKVAGAILSAPGLWSRKTMGLFQRGLLWVSAHVMPWATVSGREMGRIPSDNYDMLRALGRDPHIIKETKVAAIHGLVDLMDAGLESAPRITVPLLVLYGENDQIIPPKPLQLFMDALPEEAKPRQRLALYPKGWHMLTRDLQAATVHEDILAWIANPEAKLPSGAESEARERLGKLVAK
jgi:alpha-beta hydrolase superfamily lysophospholipase